MPGVYTKLLFERSREYYERTSDKNYGKSFSQLKEESGGEEAWMESLPETHALGEVIKGNGGPLIMGQRVS
jgi:hypothetical protein